MPQALQYLVIQTRPFYHYLFVRIIANRGPLMQQESRALG